MTDKLEQKFLKIPELISSEIVFDAFLKIRHDQLRHKGQSFSYYTLIPPASSVAILATTNNGTIILNEEYRHPTGKILLGVPGGYLDKGENPIQAAQRELVEETGYEAKNFVVIGSSYPCPGISPQKIYTVVAFEAEKKRTPQLDLAENMTQILMTMDQIKQEISQGREIDGVMCSSLFLYETWINK